MKSESESYTNLPNSLSLSTSKNIENIESERLKIDETIQKFVEFPVKIK